ncbi:two component transcriptional regulator, LuxR family [Aureimonas altamirensis DSM 21988]|uniref:Two component transcriptional regulator, LuxR family n=1 Tax=Aureimonas altamirensis DSM 21988 TaxID=1121026 RepID=A0ABY1IFS3_9HYPH|nr:response regulator transcription factor [Aureimonas altamirensis]UHD46835.1 response regulator transcription factor [Aureimonas altamirensis]SHJ11331.1 two component transcriptional regulator, LuxR family [Aureimonas altamirensis DSM 21988]
MTKVLIVDDHMVVRDGVRRLIAPLQPEAIAEAETPRDALDAFRRMRPDIVILDINLRGGSGLEVLRRLHADDAKARIVVFSMYSDLVYATSARREGALGYVSKSAPSDELLTAIRRALRGETYVDCVTAATQENAAINVAARLSTRELEILHMLGEGQSLNDIASGLGVAYKTIANSSTRIKEKLGLERTSDLIRFAVETRGGRLVGGI